MGFDRQDLEGPPPVGDSDRLPADGRVVDRLTVMAGDGMAGFAHNSGGLLVSIVGVVMGLRAAARAVVRGRYHEG
jgi:hypothetical protein